VCNDSWRVSAHVFAIMFSTASIVSRACIGKGFSGRSGWEKLLPWYCKFGQLVVFLNSIDTRVRVTLFGIFNGGLSCQMAICIKFDNRSNTSSSSIQCTQYAGLGERASSVEPVSLIIKRTTTTYTIGNIKPFTISKLKSRKCWCIGTCCVESAVSERWGPVPLPPSNNRSPDPSSNCVHGGRAAQ
jgi:hypothetical protein